MAVKMFNWIILFFGVWVVLSPILLGSVGTVLFYSNVIVGSTLVIVALRGIMSGKSVKI
jgi:hypothetical protein